jgi:outer membrane protein assembly factor BamA
LKRRRPFVLCFAIIFFSLLYRDAVPQVTVADKRLLNIPLDAIEIEGNDVTRKEIILREMHLRVGAVAGRSLLEADLLRVRDLNLFNRVEFLLTERDGKNVLIIRVTEKWYIFPLPYWNFKDNDPNELVYGFRYLQQNFRGRNESLTVDLWSGADRGYHWSHLNPWVQGTPGLSRSVAFSQVTKSSRRLDLQSQDLEEHHTSAEMKIGKRWSIESTSEVGVKFRLVRAEDPRLLAGSGGLDRILEAQSLSFWDLRDSRIYPQKGIFLQGQLLYGWLLDSNGSYRRIALDARKYVQFHEVTLALRAQWSPGWGDVPPYDWFVAGDTSPIRSAGLSDEGISFWKASFETRKILYPVRYFTWEHAPFLKRYFRNLEYGLAASLFVDAGDIYTQAKSVTGSSVSWGYGGGLLFMLPYVNIFRVELSLNPELPLRKARVSARLGISF